MSPLLAHLPIPETSPDNGWGDDSGGMRVGKASVAMGKLQLSNALAVVTDERLRATPRRREAAHNLLVGGLLSR